MKQQFSAFSYKVVNQSDDSLDIYVDGIIVDAETQNILKNWFGDETSVSYKSFRDQVTKANPKTVNLFVNSDGGMVNDALAIHDFMVDLEGKGVVINRKVRGLAASAATFLVMGNNSSMSENSWLMIHNVSGVAFGNVDDLERYAAQARKINNQLVSFYANKTGLKEADIQDMMNKETWMNATEAKEKGFIDSIDGKVKFSNKIPAEHWQFNNTAVLNSYNSSVQTDDNHSFLQNIKSEYMKLVDSLKGVLKTAKEDKTTDKIDNKEAILDMVEKVLTPFATAIDEKIKDEVKEEEKTEEKKVEKVEEKKSEEKKDEKVEDKKELSEVEQLKAEVAAMKLAMANSATKPKSEVVTKGKVEANIEYMEN